MIILLQYNQFYPKKFFKKRTPVPQLPTSISHYKEIIM